MPCGQPDNAAAQVAGSLLKRSQQGPADAAAADGRVNPHAPYLCGRLVEPAYGPAAHRAAADVSDEERSRWWNELLLGDTNGLFDLEATRKPGIQFLLVTLQQLIREVAGWLLTQDVEVSHISRAWATRKTDTRRALRARDPRRILEGSS